MEVTIHPLTPDRWADLETLFGPSGAYGGCWCMWFRMRRGEFNKSTGAKNRAALKRIVDDEQPPGLIAYVDGTPAGWVSLDPRERFPMLMHGPSGSRSTTPPSGRSSASSSARTTAARA